MNDYALSDSACILHSFTQLQRNKRQDTAGLMGNNYNKFCQPVKVSFSCRQPKAMCPQSHKYVVLSAVTERTEIQVNATD